MHILCLISVHIILSDWKLIEQIILCDTWSWYLCVCRSMHRHTANLRALCCGAPAPGIQFSWELLAYCKMAYTGSS